MNANVANCKRKIPFQRFVDARYRAHLEMKRHPETVQYVYRCPVCARWHLTTKSGGRSIDVRNQDKCKPESPKVLERAIADAVDAHCYVTDCAEPPVSTCDFIAPGRERPCSRLVCEKHQRETIVETEGKVATSLHHCLEHAELVDRDVRAEALTIPAAEEVE